MIEVMIAMVLMSAFFYFVFDWGMFNKMMLDIRRSKERTVSQKQQCTEAIRRLSVEAAETAYQPAISQEALNAVDHSNPWPAASLIEQEQARIAQYLLPIWRNAGFPDKPPRIVRRQMEQVWLNLQGRLHQKAFAHLELPSFFDVQRDKNGLIMFEMTRPDRDHYGNEQWIGVQSRWIYGRNPPQLSDPLMEGAL